MTEVTSVPLTQPYPWQAGVWQRLCRQHEDGRLPHALMLVGPVGIGKGQLARALAAYLLCQAPQSAAACGRCKACELLLAGTHPDLARVGPEEGSRVIKIDQVRSVTEFIAKTAQQGGRKVAIIEPVEALNTNAANALLKSLEEPSGDTVLILVSQHPSGVLATIRSRCQLLELGLPSEEDSLAWLTPLAVGQDPRHLLQCAGGAPLAAFTLLEGDALAWRETLAGGLAAIAGGRQSAVAMAAELQSGDPLVAVEHLLRWLQLGLRSRSGRPHEASGTEATLLDLLARVPQPLLFRFWDKLIRCKRQLLSSANPNKQLLLEEMLLDWEALVQRATAA